MFQTLVNQIWSPAKSTKTSASADSPHAATSEQSENEVDESEAKVDLYKVNGADAEEFILDAKAQFQDDQLIIIGKDVTTGQEGMKKFDCVSLRHFRQHQEDMFQWIVTKGKSLEDGEEYGLLFNDSVSSKNFLNLMMLKLRSSASVLKTAEVDFREYDRETKEWKVVEEKAKISIVQRESDLESFLISCDCETDTPLCQLTISHDEYIFIQPELDQISWWGSASAEGVRRMFGAHFSCDEKEKNEFFQLLDRVLMEASGGEKIDPNMDVDQAMGYDESAFETGMRPDEKEEEMDWMEEDQEQSFAQKPVEKKQDIDCLQHKCMEVGTDRTFVIRSSGAKGRLCKNDMQVFGFDELGKENIVASVDGSKFQFNKEKINPTKAMLHGSETKLILMAEGDKNGVYLMDIEKEEIVNRYDADNMKIQNIMEASKGSGLTHDPTFVAHNPQAIFSMDTRQKNARGKTLSYTSKVQFTCGATDEAGHILMGNHIGELRLYDGEENKDGKLKRAKTHLNGLGDPLSHVAVTKDGSWILGTTKKYLVLFPVRLADTGKTGFVTALGQKKPKPIVLKLKLEDIANYGLQDICFTKAEFDENETTIVTATSNMAIIWDFCAIKKGEIDAYSIRTVDECIRDVAFLQNQSLESVVMVTPNKVNAKPLKRMTK